MSKDKVTVHTMHVPDGWTPEQTWETISRGEKVPVTDGYWTNIEVKGLEVRVLSEDATGYNMEVTAGRLVRWHPIEEGW